MMSETVPAAGAVRLRFDSAQLYLALNPETPDEVVERLQKALDELRASGRVDQIFQSYVQ